VGLRLRHSDMELGCDGPFRPRTGPQIWRWWLDRDLAAISFQENTGVGSDEV